MTKAPGSGSGPSPVLGWRQPGVGAAVAVVALLVSGALVLGWPLVRTGLGLPPSALSSLLDVVIIAGPLAIGALLAAKLGGDGIRRALGLRLTVTDAALALFVALLARAVMELTFPTVGNLVSPFASGDTTLLVVTTALGAVLIAPVCEELLFRGALQRSLHAGLLGRGVGPRLGGVVAIALSTAAFVLLHTLPYGAAVPLSALLAPLLVGIGSGALVATTGRLGPGLLMHVLFNLSGILLLLW